MTAITLTIMWIFVAIFAVLAVISILDIAGIHKIADPDQRKWLFRSLIGTVVLAVGSFGAAHFPKGNDVSPLPTPTPTLSATPSPVSSATPTPAPAPTATPAPPEHPATPKDEPATAACPAPDDVLAWARTNLGTRPVISASFESGYPKCVAEIAGQPAGEVDDGAVSACIAELNAHHDRYILPYYEAKAPYDTALRKQEARMRKTAITAETLPFYNYVGCENRDLNYPGGSGLARLRTAETRLSVDIDACGRGHCKAE